ncbi:ArsR family transcriptional regulator [Haloferax larsenii]|nr:ArsR family transcriptional regulator [Haloferax larsenii]
MTTRHEEHLTPSPSSSMGDERQHLDEMPPSASRVYGVLEQTDSPLSSTEIASRTPLASRTVRNALHRLREADLVGVRASILDPRKRQYELTDTER